MSAAIEYATAQGGGRAAIQRILHVEQRQEDIKKYGETALRMYLEYTYKDDPYTEYQLCIKGRYGY